MKKTVITLALAAIVISACNQTDKNTEDTTVAAVVKQKEEVNSPIMASYLAIGNALAKDDASEAAKAGKALAENLNSFDETKLTAEQKSTYGKIKSDAIENAEHISENADKIDHQREHYKMLSEDIYLVAKGVDPAQTLYKISCPMYKDGSYWLSKTKEINNPFYGVKMSSCGSVDETIN